MLTRINSLFAATFEPPNNLKFTGIGGLFLLIQGSRTRNIAVKSFKKRCNGSIIFA
ncbi:hypothetical protein GXM_01642 [Nostoc sphaeroides CCNUC1]|uniref:Uncharacterized protein n=1 Tax=Nostoc sphaeroides CCNUC1 TaxID=2653204 RepID=A0A5P8VWB0_9NOSO|nr:hypothetical protein GXM_01642 [Nostoc sphaeroides CCNUC1]